MKNVLLLLHFFACVLFMGQLKPNINNGFKEQQYTYHIKLLKVHNVSYPGTEIQLKLMPRAALYNNQDMISPKLASMSEVCPNFIYGYNASDYITNKSCDTKQRNILIFKDQIGTGDSFSLKIPAKDLNNDTKLTLGLYAAEIMLPNGVKKKLKKVVMRSFHLADFDHSVRNYIKYEFQIEGATIILEYLIERSTKK